VLSVVAARIKPVGQRHGSTNLSTSVRPLQGKLNKPRGADDRRDACEGAGSLDVERRGDRERWVIREIEKVSPEAEAVSLGDFERLSDGEVHVLLRRSGEAVAGNIAEPSGVASGTVGERYDGVRYEGSRVQPVGQTRFRAAVGGCAGAAEPRSKSRRGKIWAAEGIRTPAGRIDGRNWASGLQRENTADFPATESSSGKSLGVRVEGKMVNEAGDETMPTIEI